MQCRLCDSEEESESHLIECSEVVKKIGNDFNLIDSDYLDIFSNNLEDQIEITKIFEKIMKVKTLHSNTD